MRDCLERARRLHTRIDATAGGLQVAVVKDELYPIYMALMRKVIDFTNRRARPMRMPEPCPTWSICACRRCSRLTRKRKRSSRAASDTNLSGATAESPSDVDDAAGGEQVAERAQATDVEHVARVEEQHLAEYVQTEQVAHGAVVGRQRLRQRGRQSEAGEHLHQVAVRAVEAQRQAAQRGQVRARV